MIQAHFSFPGPAAKLPRGYFYAVQHGHIGCKENCRCHFARIFTCKNVGQIFTMSFTTAKKPSKRVSALPRFLHRGTAGNMEPLTGGSAGRIRMGDR